MEIMQVHSWQRFLTGSVLLLLMSVPSFVPALHEILHAHNYHTCKAVGGDAHFHADGFDCDLCDYLTSVVFPCDQSSSLVPMVVPESDGVIVQQDLISHVYRGLRFLRGPPDEV